jgi:hypothetical protein
MTAPISELELTKKTTPLVPFLQRSVISLSCSLASFMYADHILSTGSSWAVGGVTEGWLVGLIFSIPRRTLVESKNAFGRRECYAGLIIRVRHFLLNSLRRWQRREGFDEFIFACTFVPL